VAVPNEVFRDWIRDNYRGVIEESLRELRGSPMQVQFTVGEDDDPVSDDGGGAQGSAHGPPAAPSSNAGPPSNGSLAAAETQVATSGRSPISGTLNPKYSFSTFVVGASNQFAHAAARAVAESPSKSYNPLFLYGGVGLGKTHLMHAIGHHILENTPGLRLVYLSSERFMNELINSIRYDRTFDFREKYRNIDVLLMDDIQFLAGKERTQEEFFHTFNALYESQRQIVLTSDSPPKEIPTLEERLRSRFEWGLLADIQPPDLETKVAILKKKAEVEDQTVEDDVLMFIAQNSKSNIRELEGALIRLIAYSSLTGEEITVDLARDVLRDTLASKARAITIDRIQENVSEYFGLKRNEITSKSNARRITHPRQIAMFLCKELTDHSLPEIGRAFGGKHHSTVIHSVRKVEEECETDEEIHGIVNTLREALQ